MTRDAEFSSLGPGGEFDRIRAIWRRLGTAGGVGDDCAVVTLNGARLAFSTDLSVQDVHFRTGWLAPLEIGWRSAAAALSDLAAVAAQPRGILVSLGVPADWPGMLVAELMEGAAGAARQVGAEVWGGDLVRANRVLLDVAVVGELAGDPVWRRGAAPGDALWVTGELGGPNAALQAWQRGTEPDARARERFARPMPRIAEAAWLRDHGARAMIDLSDGLVADASHLAAASSVRCAIRAEEVPRHPAAGRMDPLEGGEEYELLVALPAAFDAAADFTRQFGLPLTRVGAMEQGAGVLVTEEGQVVEVGRVYRHF
jgi:thiamine-monophosphate kinase